MKPSVEQVIKKQQHWRWEILTTSPEMDGYIKQHLASGDYDHRYALKRITELEQEVEMLKQALKETKKKDDE